MNKVLPTISFRSKLAAFSTAAVVVTATVISLTGYAFMTEQAHKNAMSQLHSEASLNGELVEARFESMVRDATILMSGPGLTHMLKAYEAEQLGISAGGRDVARLRQRLHRVFSAYLGSQPFYTQVRLLTVQGNGMELVRVDRREHGMVAVSRDDLQAKGDEPYMRNLANARRAYFSEVSLNREKGVVDGPGTPTIRLVHPIFDIEGNTMGAVVINAAFEDVIRSIRPQLAEQHNLSIITRNGDHMEVTNSTSGAFIMMRDSPDWTPSPFDATHTEHRAGHPLAEADDRGFTHAHAHSENGQIWHAAQVTPINGSDGLDLRVVAFVSDEFLNADARHATNLTIKIIAGLVCLSLIVAWFAASRLTAPLRDLTFAIQSRRDSLEPLNFIVRTDDEIGRMANAFTKLINDLVSRTNHATAVFQSAADGIMIFDAEGWIQGTNPSLNSMFGYEPGELIGQHLSDLLPGGQSFSGAEALQNLTAIDNDPLQGAGTRIQAQHRSGRLLEIEASTNLVEGTGDSARFVGILRDITLRCAAEKELREQTEALRQTTGILETTFDSIEQGVLVLDRDLNILVWSSRLLDIMDYDRKSIEKGISIRTLLGNLYDWGDFVDTQGSKEDVINATLDKLGIAEPVHTPSSYVRERKNGQFIEVVSRSLKDGGVVITAADVTRQEETRREIERLAMTDPLTGLANRNRLRTTIQAELRKVEAGSKLLAIMLIDLDKFKLVNDVFGHDAGDHVLVEVSERLRHRLEGKGILFRLGGDEFAICLPFDHDLNDIGNLAKTIIADLTTPIRFEGRPLEIGASIGIAVAPTDARKVESLLRKADVALYQAKNGGRGMHHFYDARLDDQERRSRQIHSDLRMAVPDSQFELYFQPRVEASNLRICGAEALLRWNHPREGLLAPSEFIAAMERSDVVFEAGEWVIREGWRYLNEWVPKFGLRDFNISVNVSARQFFEPSLLELLNDLRFTNTVFAANLELELTEEVMIDNMAQAVSVMKKIEELGYTMAIDDFGTGYSSISYLHHMPVRILKIDKSFLEPIDTRENAAAIVKTIINLGRSLGMTVTAEGVETAEHIDFLRDQGCTYLQGYYFSPPVPASQFEAMLREQMRVPKAART